MDGFYSGVRYEQLGDDGDYHDIFGDMSSTINRFSITPIKEGPQPEKYSEEELDIMEKQSINAFVRKPNFFCVSDVNKENDIKPSGPLEDMTVGEDGYIDFHIGTDPFLCGRRLYNSATVTLAPNMINTLIGCNGAGKSTLRTMICDDVSQAHYPYLMYDNLKDGGSNAIESMAFHNDFEGIAFGVMSSEGENICNNVFNFLTPLEAILTGLVTRDERYRQYRDTDHVFLIMDAVDSGFSIDNIINLKAYLNKLIELSKKNNKNLYIVVAANSFEFAVDTRSWDVQKSKEVFYTENDYVKYRKRIIETRKRILSQWEKMESKKKIEEDESLE